MNTDLNNAVFPQTVTVAINHLKHQLQHDYELAYPELHEIVHLVLDEEESRARDLTPFRVTGRVQQAVWESLGSFDVVGQLRGIRLPAVFLHGRQDPIPFESSEEGARALGAPLVMLEDCGHVPYVEQPGALFAGIDAFLAKVGKR